MPRAALSERMADCCGRSTIAELHPAGVNRGRCRYCEVIRPFNVWIPRRRVPAHEFELDAGLDPSPDPDPARCAVCWQPESDTRYHAQPGGVPDVSRTSWEGAHRLGSEGDWKVAINEAVPHMDAWVDPRAVGIVVCQATWDTVCGHGPARSALPSVADGNSGWITLDNRVFRDALEHHLKGRRAPIQTKGDIEALSDECVALIAAATNARPESRGILLSKLARAQERLDDYEGRIRRARVAVELARDAIVLADRGQP